MTPDRLQKLYDKLIAQANSHYANSDSTSSSAMSQIEFGKAIALESAALDLAMQCAYEDIFLTTTSTNSRKDIDESNKEAMQAELVNEEN